MTTAPLTLGTAGHIDHGKTALIRALTGVDTDRLPEEHARGISIELGYASLELPSGTRLSIVDVPGHERYVRTMVAGATGIDLYLMAIAADDRVMPQTREHAAVLRALEVSRGVVAVTKSDIADPEIAILEASELLPGVEVVAVSARTGSGLTELRGALDRIAQAASSRAGDAGEARLHVDRVFTIRGAGTVVTGTLWSGAITRGDSLRLLPGRRRARVRDVQVHNQSVQRAQAGQRVAVNLSGLALADVSRGDVAVSGGSELESTYLIDAQLELERAEPAHGARVQIHHGTRESAARLAWLGGPFWQIRLEQPLIAAGGDRLVVRQIAPPDTLGGGVVLDAHPRKHGPSRAALLRLQRLARGEPGRETEPAAAAPPLSMPPAVLTASALATETHLRDAGFEPPPDAELDAGDLAALRSAGRAIRVSQTLHYHPEAIAEVKRRVLTIAGGPGGSITLAQLRDELDTSRKFAQALLQHLDSQRLTIRRGDRHFVRRGRDAS
jgi:selenocysteine-specific elongation factor